MNPAQRVRADAKLTRVVGNNRGIRQQALMVDRAPCRSRPSTPGSRRDVYPAATSAAARNAPCWCAPMPRRSRR
jgi:hypothetical protein